MAISWLSALPGDTNLRATEVVSMDLTDADLEHGIVLIRASNGGERNIHYHPPCQRRYQAPLSSLSRSGRVPRKSPHDVVRHRFGLHLGVNPLNSSICSHHVGVAHHPHVIASHERLDAIAVVGGSNRAWFSVGQQGEGQLVLGNEFSVASGAVLADAEHGDAVDGKPAPSVAEAAGLLRAAGRVVYYIEIDHYAPAAQGRQVLGVAVLVGEGEIGGGITDLQGHRTMSWQDVPRSTGHESVWWCLALFPLPDLSNKQSCRAHVGCLVRMPRIFSSRDMVEQ